MNRCLRPLLVLVLVVIAGCGNGNGGGSVAATTSSTTTTQADPAATSCRETHSDVQARPKEDPTLDRLTLSRDSRIVAAAREVESILQARELDADAVPPDLDVEYANAVLELTRACKAAGYLP
jgi:hypothetical protein